MSNISITQLTKKRKQNRLFFAGPTSTTWFPPDGVTEVEVYVWGGGGNGATATDITNGACSGGGGGGYVSHVYKNLTSTTSLSIVVGDSAGTSSVSCPSHPIHPQPISATGGSPGTTSTSLSPGGAGGSGSFSSVPVPLRVSGFTNAYSGGAGGSINNYPGVIYTGAGGGAAGSHLGVGGTGASATPSTGVTAPYIVSGGSGGGIGNQPGQLLAATPTIASNSNAIDTWNAGQAGFPLHAPFGAFGTRLNADTQYIEYDLVARGDQPVVQNRLFPYWFYLDEIVSLAGSSDSIRFQDVIPSPSPTTIPYFDLYGQAGRGNVSRFPSPAPFLGGGAGSQLTYVSVPFFAPPTTPTFYGTSGPYTAASYGGGGGGGIVNPGPIPGGTAGPSAGGKGIVIIYW